MKRILILLALVGLLVAPLGTSAEDDHGDSPLTATPVPADGSLTQGIQSYPPSVLLLLKSL
jgi:hypothetical protein